MCMMLCRCFCFFLTVAATSEVYTLSLRDALPICSDGDNFFRAKAVDGSARDQAKWRVTVVKHAHDRRNTEGTYTKGDRKSTRLNSSHSSSSYAVFCLKKKKMFCPKSPCVHPSHYK